MCAYVLGPSLSQSVSPVRLFVCIHDYLSSFIRVFCVYFMDVSRYVTTQKRMLISACEGMSCTRVDGVAARQCVCTHTLASWPPQCTFACLPARMLIQSLIETQQSAFHLGKDFLKSYFREYHRYECKISYDTNGTCLGVKSRVCRAS